MGRRTMLMTTQEKVAAGLSGEDVKVTFDYHRPVVNIQTKNIRLPPPPEDVDEETEINMRSWIDHESGHVRFSTDAWDMELVKDKVMKNLCFALEDCRVDRKNGEKFPGTRDNRRRGYDVVRPKLEIKNVLQAAYRVLYEQVKEYYNLESSIVYWTQMLNEPTALLGLAQLMDAISDLIIKLRVVETQKQVIDISREIKERWKNLFKSGGQGDADSDKENKMSDGGQFNERPGSKKSKKDKKGKKKSSSESGDQQESDDLNEDESGESSEGKSKDKKTQKDSDEDDTDDGGDDDANEKDDSDNEDGKEGSNSDGAGDDEDSEGDSDDEDGDDDDTGSDGADPGDGKESDDDSDKNDDSSEDGKDDTDSESSGEDDREGQSTGGDDDEDDEQENGGSSERSDVEGDMDDMMDDFKSAADSEKDELEDRFNTSNESRSSSNRRFGGSCPPGYRSYTGGDSVIDLEPQTRGLTTYDEWGRAQGAMSPEQFRSEIRAKLGTFQRRLMRVLMARRRLWVKDREDGALDDSRLHRVPTGDKRVFKRQLSRPSLNIAVSVLLDMSGSMMGYAQYLCAQLGYILAETCSLIRVPFESLGFTTGSSYGLSRSKYQRSYRGIGDSVEVEGVYYHRNNPLKLIVVKPFEMTRRGDMLTKFYAAASWCGGGTTEGEAIWWAARRLAQQRRQRRLLITICDGSPNGSPAPYWKFEEHVSTTIDRLRRAGIETMHVGIGTDAPKSYVPEETFVRYDGIDSLITEFAPAFGAILLNERSRNTPPIPIH